MNLKRVRRWLLAALIGGCLACAPPAEALTPAGWKDSGFSINADGMMLRDVLAEFGKTYGVRIALDVPNVRMKGRLKAEGGSEFLDRLAQPYKFRWFVYNDTLHIVSREDNASLRLQVGEDAVQDAKQALIGLGLFESRFGWGELPDEGVVIVSGPRLYVNFARDILTPKMLGPDGKPILIGKQVMVFRLKYASATDRTVNLRGKTETIPGVKTILSALLLGTPEASEKVSGPPSNFDAGSRKRSREPRVEKGDAAEVGKPRPAEHAAESEKRKPGAREERPAIEADPGLNAILIYGNVNRRPVYQSLIDQLDQPPQQIEIEALIIDIDRSRLSEMGIEWGVRSGEAINRMNATGADSRGTELPLPGSTFMISNAGRFYARLKALEGAGQASILAKPTVLTLNNEMAVLDLSQTAYLPLIGERVADVRDVTAGTTLKVVPHLVHEEDGIKVRMEINIEDGAIGSNSPQLSVTRSTISTQAIVELQQTLMIGGYHAESVARGTQKVPVLGDVPLFGNLFRSESDKYSNRERLFLITPRLAGNASVAARRSDASRVATRVLPAERYAFGKLLRTLDAEHEARRAADPKPAPAPEAVQVRAASYKCAGRGPTVPGTSIRF